MVLDEVAAFLAANVPGLVVGTNVFLGDLPDTPDEAVALYEYGGLSPVGTFGNRHKYERPSIQVVCRGPQQDYLTPRTTAKNIFVAMNSGARILSGTRYMLIVAKQSPFEIDTDANGRVKIACNYHIEKDVS